MKKIISLFKRDYEGTRLVYNEVVEGAEWVIAGEGVATRKWDGTCCMVRDGKLYKRFDAKRGKTPPAGFEPAQDYDEITGHMPGWVPVRESNPEDRWHMMAWDNQKDYICDGTYELCGPKVQGNPEKEYVDAELRRSGTLIHILIPHGRYIYPDAPRDFDGLKAFFAANDIEGIVWHHPDGRMVKIKAKDFGIHRGVRVAA